MLNGNKIHLKSLERKDLWILYRISNEEDVMRYNIKSYNMQNCNIGENLRKALSIINENNILIGFITYKQNEVNKELYSIGITIGTKYWGKGYGQDAIKTLLKYLFIKLNAEKVELEVMEDNIRAIECYMKCGFVKERIKKNSIYSEKKDADILIMGIINYN